MKASVSIPTNELKRLFLSAIKGKTFSRRVVSELTNALLDRIERDYPDMLKHIYHVSYRRYQNDVAQRLKKQRESNSPEKYGED